MVLLTILCSKTNDWKKSTTRHQQSTFQTSPYNHLTGEVYGAQRPYVVTSNHGYGVPEVGLSQFKSGLQSHCDMGQDLMRPVPLASFKRHAAAVSVRAEFRRKGHSIHFADQTSRPSKPRDEAPAEALKASSRRPHHSSCFCRCSMVFHNSNITSMSTLLGIDQVTRCQCRPFENSGYFDSAISGFCFKNLPNSSKSYLCRTCWKWVKVAVLRWMQPSQRGKKGMFTSSVFGLSSALGSRIRSEHCIQPVERHSWHHFQLALFVSFCRITNG